MDLVYFLVTSLDKYADKFGFHSYYFENCGALGLGAFYEALIAFGVLGAVVAVAFYFCLCNGESVKYATRVNWLIGLLLVAVVSYLISDLFFIGTDGNPGSGFYAACQAFANDFMKENMGNEQMVQDCQSELNIIIDDLRKGSDVAVMYNLTNAIISMLLYFLTSVGVKNFTKHGSQIPF